MAATAPTANPAAAAFGLGEAAEATVIFGPAQAAYAAPVAPWSPDGAATRRVEGARTDHVVVTDTLGALEAASAAAAWFAGRGWRETFRCADAACGGFDFRLAVEVAPMPTMRLNLADFHQITLERATSVASILASRAAGRTLVQIVTVEGAAPAEVARPASPARRPDGDASHGGPSPTPASAAPAPTAADGGHDVGAALDAVGFATLEAVAFQPGSLRFAEGAAAGLDAAAAALAARPAMGVVIVGHTDAVGGLDVNQDVGRRRAAAVLEALAARGVARDRMRAESVGWLAPRAGNDDAAGRARNRRVVLLAR